MLDAVVSLPVRLLHLGLTAYTWIILARVVVSWAPVGGHHPAVRFLYRVTEPVLEPIRRRLPMTGGVDFSPMVALVGVYLLRELLVPVLRRIVLDVE